MNQKSSRIREGFLFLKGVYIRVYLLGRHEITDKELPCSDEIASIIWNFIEAGIARGEPREVRARAPFRYRKHPECITALKQKKQKYFPFIIVNIQTVMLNNVLVPYASGLLVVNRGMTWLSWMMK